MKDLRVELTIVDGVAKVVLNRPDKLNAMDMAMFYQLLETQKLVAKNKHVRVVILSGRGQDFCSGLDVKEVLSKPSNGLRLLFKWLLGNANKAQLIAVGWRRLKVPVIAAIHGRCWGGGMQLVLGADFRICSQNASLAIMENKWGMIPDMGGSLSLPEIMPMDQAMKLTMLAEPISAQEALELELITECVEDPIKRSQELAEQLKTRSPDAITNIKKLYQNAWHHHDRKLLALETKLQIKTLLGKNQKIAVKRNLSGDDIPWKL